MALKFFMFMSTDCGRTYKETKFETADDLGAYIGSHKKELLKNRWCVEDERGSIILVCTLFEKTREAILCNKASMVSDDEKLTKYLNMDRKKLQ